MMLFVPKKIDKNENDDAEADDPIGRKKNRIAI